MKITDKQLDWMVDNEAMLTSHRGEWWVYQKYFLDNTPLVKVLEKP